MLSKYDTVAVLSGCYWAAVGYWLGHRAMPTFIWGGVVAAPLIGWCVGRVCRPVFGAPLYVRIVLSLATLYLAAGLFGAACGLADLARPIASRSARAVVVQSILATWWGVTFTGVVIVLWPLAFANHAWIARYASRPQQESP